MIGHKDPHLLLGYGNESAESIAEKLKARTVWAGDDACPTRLTQRKSIRLALDGLAGKMEAS